MFKFVLVLQGILFGSKIGIVGTPGSGFGKNGENWLRLTSFNTIENTTKAMEKFYNFFK